MRKTVLVADDDRRLWFLVAAKQDATHLSFFTVKKHRLASRLGYLRGLNFLLLISGVALARA